MRLHRPTPCSLARSSCLISVALAVVLGVILALIALDSSYEPSDSLLSSLGDILLTFSFALVGAIVVIKRPDNLVGWALSLAGIGLLAGGVLSAYGELALLAKPEVGLPGGAAAAAMSGGSWTALMAGVFLLLLVFPAGRVPSRRWRRLATLVLIGFTVVWAVITTVPGELGPPLDDFENPLAFTSSKGYIAVIFPIIGFCLVCVALAAVKLLLRFRRSRGEERQQFKWFAGNAGLLLLTLPFAAAFDYSNVAGAVFGIALIGLPVSVGIAVLRYRLYEIDRIVNRTIVYGVVTAGLAGLYLAIVLGLQEIFSGFTRGNDLAIAGSTLAVAALFRPVRGRIQTVVDRRFYRRRYDAQQTLEAFSARLRDEVDLDTLGADLGAVVQSTMQPAHLSLWLRRPEVES